MHACTYLKKDEYLPLLHLLQKHATQKRCRQKATRGHLAQEHNQHKCAISINVLYILNAINPGFTVLDNWRLFCKCHQEEIKAKGGINHLALKLLNSTASTGSRHN